MDGLAALELVKVFDPGTHRPRHHDAEDRRRYAAAAPARNHASADRHAHRQGRHRRQGPLAQFRRRRLPRQAVRLRGADRAAAGQAAPARSSSKRTCCAGATSRSIPARARPGAGKEPLEFTQREFDLLEVFLREPRRVFSKDHLLEIVWGHDFEGGPNIVETYISYLRAKIDRPGEPGSFIRTVRGVGYGLSQ